MTDPIARPEQKRPPIKAAFREFTDIPICGLARRSW